MKLFLLFALTAFSSNIFSQSVGIGTAAPNASAQLDVSSTSKGILIPRMTTAQRNAVAAPSNGLMIYNTTTKQYNFYNGVRWQNVSGIPKGAMILSNSNYDTAIIKEGFTQEGFITNEYLKQTFGDTIIAALNWYTGNRSEYQNSSAPQNKNITGFNGTELFVFENDSIFIYSPAADRWVIKPVLNSTVTNILIDIVQNGTIVWTGTEFLLWGGGQRILNSLPCGTVANPQICYLFSPTINTGLKYNPATNNWIIMSVTNAPAPRYHHKAVWTGTEMIVWGGKSKEPDSLSSFENTGGRYNPATNVWQPLSIPPSFEGRQDFTMTYAANKVIIWGGKSIEPKTRTITFPCGAGTVTNFNYDSVRNYRDGMIYNTANNTWTTMSAVNAPMARYNATAEWYVDRLIVAGGSNTAHSFTCVFCGVFSTPCGKAIYTDSMLRTGASYNPSLNTWTVIPDAPKAFTSLSSFFDNEQYIWMYGADSTILFEPSADDWLLLPQNPLPVFNNPLGRQLVWQGSISNNGIAEKIAFPGTLHPSGKAAVYNYKVNPTTLPEIKSFSAQPATKFYLYKRE
jgi:hypothetical protein